MATKDAIPEKALTEAAKIELNKIREIENMVHREILVYGTNEYTYDFKYFRTRNTFGRDIYNRKITLKEYDEDQSILLVVIMNFKKRPKPKKPRERQNRKYIPKKLI